MIRGGIERAPLRGLQSRDVVEGLQARRHPVALLGRGDDVDLGAAQRLADRRVHGEGEQLAGDDHHLVDGDDRSADALGRRFGQVDGDGGAGAADRESQDDAEDVHHPHIGGEGGAQGAQEEEDRQHGDVVPPTVAIGQARADERPQRGADEQGAADCSLLETAQLQALGPVGHVHVGQGAGDDPRVVAEEQRTESGHAGDGEDSAALARWRGVVDGLFHRLRGDPLQGDRLRGGAHAVVSLDGILGLRRG